MPEIEGNQSYILHLLKPNFRYLPLAARHSPFLAKEDTGRVSPQRKHTVSIYPEKPVPLLQPTQREIYFPNSPPAPSSTKTKAGKQEFLIWLPQLGPRGPNSSEMKYKVHKVCGLLVTRNTKQQNQSRVTCLEPPRDGGWGVVCSVNTDFPLQSLV